MWIQSIYELMFSFLSEHPDDANRTAGTVWAYVDKIELSSYLDSVISIFYLKKFILFLSTQFLARR